VVQWLRDGLKIITDASETQSLSVNSDPSESVIIVPAFTGLGAPYWKPDCRGAIFGLTRNTGPEEFARAALESVGYQTLDLLDAMRSDWGTQGSAALRVDGGMSASDWTMQFLSDITGAQVDRPIVLETTAMGAAWLAGYKAGIYPSQEDFARTWALESSFTPQMSQDIRTEKYSAWKRAVAATIEV
jgi:glycerol kinase